MIVLVLGCPLGPRLYQLPDHFLELSFILLGGGRLYDLLNYEILRSGRYLTHVFVEVHLLTYHSTYDLYDVALGPFEETRDFGQIFIISDDYVHHLQALHFILATVLAPQLLLINHLKCEELNFFIALFNKLVTVLLVDDDLAIGVGYLQLEDPLLL